MGTSNKQCEVEGCEKKSWLKGRCQKHYVETYGKYEPKKRVKAEPRDAVKPEALAERIAQGKIKPEPATDDMTGFSLSLPAHVFELLETRAKEEWRTPEMQAAYMLNKELKG